VPDRRPHTATRHPGVLVAVGAGGAVGSLLRWVALQVAGGGQAAPGAGGNWPWATWAVNVAGCALIGILMAVLERSARPLRYARPFLGVGVLGGFTTFSTFAVQTVALAAGGRAGAATSYVLASVGASLMAVAGGTLGARALLTRREERA